MNNKVSVGITSVIGWLTALLALLPTIISSIESGAVAFNGPEKYLAIFGIASGLITNIARYLQAHKLITTESVSRNIPSQHDINAASREFEQGSPGATETEVAIRPESATTPDGPTPMTSGLPGVTTTGATNG